MIGRATVEFSCVVVVDTLTGATTIALGEVVTRFHNGREMVTGPFYIRTVTGRWGAADTNYSLTFIAKEFVAIGQCIEWAGNGAVYILTTVVQRVDKTLIRRGRSVGCDRAAQSIRLPVVCGDGIPAVV
jgi:hypothetical protein